jgi:hypothetical protein
VLIAGVFLRQLAVILLLIVCFFLVIVIEEKVAKFIEIVIVGIVVLATKRIRTCITKFVLVVLFPLFLFAR